MGLLAFTVAPQAALVVHIPYDNDSATNRGAGGAAFDGVLQGSASYSPDAALGGGSILLDGFGSYFNHGQSPIGGNTNRTVSIWTKNGILPTDGQRSLMAFGSIAGSPNGSKMDFDVDASANPQGVGRLEIGVNGGRTAPNYASPGVNSNEWTLVTFSWSASRGAGINGGRFFVNGNYLYAPGAATPAINTLTGTGSALAIGKSANDPVSLPSVQQYFNGQLDDAAIWDEMLSDVEVLGLYQVGAAAGLQYDAGQFQQLRSVHQAGAGSVNIGGRLWEYASALPGAAGLTTIQMGTVLVLNTNNPANPTGVAHWNDVKPAIAREPDSTTNVVSTSASLSVAAWGKGPLAYQWYQSNAPVAGATSATLTYNPLAFANEGPHFVVVSNAFGAVTSAVATLTVLGNTPVSITSHPTNVTVVQGQPVALAAVVDGSPPFNFQWWQGGAPVAGATTNPYLLASARYSDQGDWVLIVTNNFGAATSQVAVVTVLDVTPPVIANATNITVAAVSPAGTAVSLAHVTAQDDRDGVVSAVSSPAGPLYPPGISVVAVSATDAGGNTANAYFKITVLPGTVRSQTNLFENFEVTEYSYDINLGLSAGRQGGVLAPVAYTELATCAKDGQFDYLSLVGDSTYPGTLYLNPSSPNPNFASATPAHEFVESPTFAVEFDVNPSAGAGTVDWAAAAIGSPYAHVLPDATASGMGFIFRGNSQISVIQNQQQTLLSNLPWSLPTPPYRVRIEVEASAFDGSPAIIRGYVNGTPFPIASNAVSGLVYEYVKTNGFVNNFVVLSGYAQNAGAVVHTFDNFAVTALPTVFAAPSDLATVVGRSNQAFTVTVPPSLVATSAVSVVVSNANPAVAQMQGETGGLLTLNFSSGGPSAKAVTVLGLAAGSTTLTLRDPSVALAIGGKPVSVKVSGLPVHIFNGSFEEPPVPDLPGYGVIPGWADSLTTSNGVSPQLAFGGILANNSYSGHGKHVGFLQSIGALGASDGMLSTTISNLNPGRQYELSFLVNAQQGAQANAILGVLLDDQFRLSAQVDPVGASPLGYKPVGLVFTAATTVASLAISNTTLSASGLLVDNFQVKELAPRRWNTALWTGDADSGIASANTYTHAYNLGEAVNLTLNGVAFTGVAGANPTVPGRFSYTAGNVQIPNAQNNLTGESFKLGGAFVYGNARLTLEGLTPGATYQLRLFGAGFGPNDGRRVSTWSSGGQLLTVDENLPGQGNGIIVTYDYTAAGGSEVVEVRNVGFGTYHVWAFANQLVALPVQLTINQVSPTQVRIAWPAAATGYQLQASTEVAGGYANTGATPTLEGNEWVVYRNIAGRQFYRLIK